MNTVTASKLSDFVRQAPTVNLTQNCKEVLDTLLTNPEERCIAVVDDKNRPVGLIMCDRFFLRLTGLYNLDMLLREPVSRFMNRSPLYADVTRAPEELLAAAAARPGPMKSDCIVVTDGGSYTGVIHVSDLA